MLLPVHVAAGGSRLFLAPSRFSENWESMTYAFRRVRQHGLIERVPRSHRYRITLTVAQVAMCYPRLHTRALRPAHSLQPSEERGEVRPSRSHRVGRMSYSSPTVPVFS